MIFTDHSKIRSQQRGVKKDVVSFIYKYGKKVSVKGNSQKYFINKKRLNSVKFVEGDFIKKNDQSILNTAIVCKGKVVITIMKINKKVNWN
jgi:hypothetical protein|tara:strand:+ start:578 stop:850 length:273 start_codon:yes stop_codon:yes gene_type:complete